MRLFVALCPPEEVRAHLAAALPEFPPEARPVPPEQWHLTLAFLDEVADEKVDAVGRAVEVAARSARPFTLQLTGAGAFGRERGTAWVGLAGETDRLARLVRVLRGGFVAIDISLENRPFLPHLTVAHGLDLRKPAAAAALAELNAYRGPTWRAEQVLLVHSTLGPDGPRYETIGSCALTPA
jgi:2'-5' RNA ligase